MPNKKRQRKWISPSGRYVNIKAESPYISVTETVPEEIAEERLKAIRDAFQYYDGTLEQKVLKTDQEKIKCISSGKPTFLPHDTRGHRKTITSSRFKISGAKLRVNFVHANPELKF